MKTISLHKKVVDTKDLLGKTAQESLELITEPTIIKDAYTGEVVAIYTKLDQDLSELIKGLKRVKFTATRRTNGLVTQSDVIGYRPRITGSINKKTCSKTSFGNRHKSVEEGLFEVAKIANKIYFENTPDTYSKHKEFSEKVLGQYIIDDTVFTSGIINKNNPLKYHYDSGNFKGVFSIMLGLKSGIKGGYLNLPEYGVALEISDKSLSMFDGQSVLHGVTPIITNTEDSYRFTVVFYSLVQMWSCGTTDEEVNLARDREEQKLAKLLERAKGGL